MLLWVAIGMAVPAFAIPVALGGRELMHYYMQAGWWVFTGDLLALALYVFAVFSQHRHPRSWTRWFILLAATWVLVYAFWIPAIWQANGGVFLPDVGLGLLFSLVAMFPPVRQWLDRKSAELCKPSPEAPPSIEQWQRGIWL